MATYDIEDLEVEDVEGTEDYIDEAYSLLDRALSGRERLTVHLYFAF